MLKLRTPDGRVVRTARRHAHGGRLGRLAPPPDDGDAAQHVRCACDSCGAHLLGTRSGSGVSGVCLVCGSVAVSPV